MTTNFVQTHDMNRSILILSKFDSFARVAKRIADGFAADGFAVDYRLISVGQEALSRRIYREIDLPQDTPVTTMEAIFRSGDLARFAAVYLGATGGFIRDFLGRMKVAFPNGSGPRPLTLAGYPGVILREKLSGFANRCGCDFVLLNSSADLDNYRHFCRNYGLDDSGAQLFGYVFPPFRKEGKRGMIQRVLFVEQSAIPSSLKERLYLTKRLASYASAHPHYTIIIKPRLVPGEKSIFTTKYHMELLLKSLPKRPANLYIDYGNIQKLLEKTDLCLTMSSSVSLQAMWYGIPTGIIRDFGIRDEYGTDFFRESGCLISFDELEVDKFPQLHPEWLSRHFMPCEKILSNLAEAVSKEYDRRSRCNNWRSNANLEGIFSESYQRYCLEYTQRKKKTLLASLSRFRQRMIFQAGTIYQRLHRNRIPYP